MKILALEFSSPLRSVAVVEASSGPPGQGALLGEAAGTGGRAENAFALIEAVLAQARLRAAQIDLLAVGLGPGSYGGIRSALAIAQGWQLGRGMPVVGVSSTECVAAEARTLGLLGDVTVVVDAQRGEFYVERFQINGPEWRSVSPLSLSGIEPIREIEATGSTLIGPDVQKWFPNGRGVTPTAHTLGNLAPSQPATPRAEALEPIYLRQTAFVRYKPPAP